MTLKFPLILPRDRSVQNIFGALGVSVVFVLGMLSLSVCVYAVIHPHMGPIPEIPRLATVQESMVTNVVQKTVHQNCLACQHWASLPLGHPPVAPSNQNPPASESIALVTNIVKRITVSVDYRGETLLHDFDR